VRKYKSVSLRSSGVFNGVQEGVKILSIFFLVILITEISTKIFLKKYLKTTLKIE